MRKTHFKFLTFLSGLFEILLGVGTILLGIFLSLSVNEFLGKPDGAEGWFISLFFGGFIIILAWAALFCLFIAFFICLVLGIMLIVSSFRNDRVFEKRKGFVIFTIVCDFLLAIALVFVAFALSGALQIGCFAVAALMLILAILKIVEIRINKKHIEKLDEQEALENGQNKKVGVDFSALSKTKSENEQQEQKDELQKLEEMKKSGIVSEEEYQQRKNEIKGENK